MENANSNPSGNPVVTMGQPGAQRPKPGTSNMNLGDARARLLVRIRDQTEREPPSPPNEPVDP